MGSHYFPPVEFIKYAKAVTAHFKSALDEENPISREINSTTSRPQAVRLMRQLSRVALLLYSLSVPVSISSDEDYVNPARLLVTTVVDTSSAEIMRDALTLIRSLRLFGGSLNEAKFVACLPVERGNTSRDNQDIIHRLTSLGVEISFINQAESPTPKTMNKFEALKKFDAIQFDYILWLDADIVVFADPLLGAKRLSLHRYPGSIDCVPDFYSYMRRYPHVNRTSIVWNPALPTWLLTGDGEIAPFATCNTGVLFFDAESVKRFLDALPDAIVKVDELNPYKQDRFLDSLYFVAAVHSHRIQVDILPFEFNYMAFFEVEIFEEFGYIENPVFIHFLSDTMMSCFAVEGEDVGGMERQESDGVCRCIYSTSLAEIPANSVILRTIQPLLQPSICSKMAGLTEIHLPDGISRQRKYLPTDNVRFRPPHSDGTNDIGGREGVRQRDEGSEEDDDTGTSTDTIEYELLWPPFNASVLYIPSLDNFVIVPILIRGTRALFATSSHTTFTADGSHHSADSTNSTEVGAAPLGIDSIRIEYDVQLFPVKGSPGRGHKFQCFESDSTLYSPMNTDKKAGEGGTVAGSDGQLPIIIDASIDSDRALESFYIKREVKVFISEADSLSSVVSGRAMLTIRLKVLVNTHNVDSNNAKYEEMADSTVEEGSSEASPDERGSSLVFEAESHIVLVVESLTPLGTVAYGLNPLISAKPAALASQLQLPEYLNARSISAGAGVVFCCDTVKGIRTVKNLIRDWHGGSGSYLLIAVAATPTALRVNTSALAVELADYHDLQAANRAEERMNSANKVELTRCIVTTGSSDDVLRLAYSIKKGTVGFVYIDTYFGYHYYLLLLTQWFALINDNGIMAGSRYQNQNNFAGDDMTVHYRKDLEYPVNIKHAVEAFGLSALISPLLTYAENYHEFCDDILMAESTTVSGDLIDSNRPSECLPSWYFMRLVVRYL